MGAGRPSKYKVEYAEQAYKYCLLGADDAKLALLFDVAESTINLWKKEHEEFSESVKKGKDIADAEVAAALYHRAKGYSHKDVHIANFQGEVIITPITKYYPPDTGAAMAWLKNRQPDKWRDKQEVESVNTNLNADLTEQQAEEILRKHGIDI